MNSIHDKDKNDSSIDSGLDSLRRSYDRLGHDEPPDLLDQAILNSAHRAIENKPHWMKFGWLHGLTTAAVFVLAFSLILNQTEPVPDYENSLQVAEPVQLLREKAVGKPSSDDQYGDSPMEKKAQGEKRKDLRQDMPAPAAAESPVKETTVGDRAGQSAAKARRSLYIQENLKSESEGVDKDDSASDLMAEESPRDEADLVVDALGAQTVSVESIPAVSTGLATGEMKKQLSPVEDAELKIQAILKLKQAGNATWKTELKTFIEDYPDYPLPDELR